MEKEYCWQCGRADELKLNLDGLRVCAACMGKNSELQLEMMQRLEYGAASADFSEISERLYLGSAMVSNCEGLLSAKGITHILVCGKSLKSHYPDKFEYLQLPILDMIGENLFPHFLPAFKFIESAKKVFIHCAAGYSRSPAIVIGYLIYSQKLTCEEAYAYVSGKRKPIGPNPGFMQQLRRLAEFAREPSPDWEKVKDLTTK